MSELELTRSVPVRMWIFAGLGALALHAGGVAFAVARFSADDLDDNDGAPGLFIDVDVAAPRSEATDLPPGPEQDASAASPAVVEQKAVTEQSELPKDVPVESEDPDRVVTQNDSIKPKEEVTVAAVQTAPSEESIAAEATAAPSMEVKEDIQSKAKVQGTGKSAEKVIQDWAKGLSAHFERHKRYPADRTGKAGEVTVSFTLDRTGHILASSIVTSSGDSSLDAAALDMLKRSDPVPPPPPLVADEQLSYTIPVIFRVKGKS